MSYHQQIKTKLDQLKDLVQNHNNIAYDIFNDLIIEISKFTSLPPILSSTVNKDDELIIAGN